jgi:peptide deformylase
MAIRDILIWPNPILATKAEPVETIDEDLKRVALDMVETMYAARGIGLAANQIGITKRLVVIDLNSEEDDEHDPALGPHIFINPVITAREGSVLWEEGCLSVPGEVGDVERSANITLCYNDLNGDEITVDASELMAVCIQHELDHLNGVVFPERMHDRSRAREIRLAMKSFKSS